MPRQTDTVAAIQAAVEADDASTAEALVTELLGETVVYTFLAVHKWPPKCGTVAGYQHHIATGQATCQPCRDANTARDKKARKLAKERAQRRRQAVTFIGRIAADTPTGETETMPAIGAKVYFSSQNLPSTMTWDESQTVPFVVSVGDVDRELAVMPDTLEIARLVTNGDAAISDYHKVRSATLVAVTDEPEPETDPFAAV